MKKKALTVILPLCVAVVMTACGGNEDTVKVEETAVAAEGAETDAQAEAEVEEQSQAEAEEQTENAEVDAFYEAGRRSLYGLDGAEIDREEAYTNFMKSQELGNTDANFYLGVLADDYYGYPKQDYKQAKEYYEQSGDNSYAKIALGFIYYYGKGVKRDYEKGEELFRSATDQGVVEGYYGLARAEEDFVTALEYYNKVVEEGTEQFYITKAMCDLGNAYLYGLGVEQDCDKAMEWLIKAADLGETRAMSSLGQMYQFGDRVEQDYDKAMEWYIKAADLGYTYIFCEIGNGYRWGFYGEPDCDKAIEWYTKGADLGDASAMSSLGNMYANGYENGNGMEWDYDKAMEWYIKAADLGDASAMSGLGNMYRFGDGVEQDYDKAMEWYIKAADLGDTGAMSSLGDMYQFGDGVEQDYDKAIEWYTKAADLNDSIAQYELEQMSQEQ